MELVQLLVNSKITGLCQWNKTYFFQALNQTLQTTEMNSENTVRVYKFSKWTHTVQINYKLSIVKRLTDTTWDGAKNCRYWDFCYKNKIKCVCKILKLNAEKHQKGSFPLPDVGEIVVGIEDALAREVNAQSGLDKNIYEKKQTSR